MFLLQSTFILTLVLVDISASRISSLGYLECFTVSWWPWWEEKTWITSFFWFHNVKPLTTLLWDIKKSARFFGWGSILLFQATTNAPTSEDVSASGIKKTSAQSQSHHYIFRHFFFQASTPRRCGLSLACRQSDLQQKCHRLSRVLWMRRTQRGPSPGCLGYIIQKSTLPKLT